MLALNPLLTLTPIGHVRSPYGERADAPRQPRAAEGVEGRIELANDRSFEDALEDLAGFSHLWVIFWFHQNTTWKPKVMPPRSTVKRGVFATRSPHRPNPLGLSVVRLDRIDGLTLHVSEIDMLDGTPVLDLKPYVPWADAIPDAREGWLDEERIDRAPAERPRDPRGAYAIEIGPLARAQLDYLASQGEAIEDAIRRALELGPQPHAYRRIRPLGDGTSRLGVKAWRVFFRVEGTVIQVLRVASGHRAAALAGDHPELPLHRAFIERFGAQ